jgi:DNA-binding cell septation regulator SpoVG
MKIDIEHHDNQFNVALTSPTGNEPFITIKGCRIMQGPTGPFVSWPSRKQENGKFWNHVYASRAFGDAVLSAYNKSTAGAPPPPPRRAPPPPAAAPAKTGFDDMDDDIPF